MLWRKPSVHSNQTQNQIGQILIRTIKYQTSDVAFLYAKPYPSCITRYTKPQIDERNLIRGPAQITDPSLGAVRLGSRYSFNATVEITRTADS